MAAVAVTEPDFGSDVAGIKVHRHAGPTAGWVDQRREDVVHVRRPGPTCSCCWPAPTPTGRKTHRGLSLFVVPKPRGEGHGFEFTQDDAAAGRMEGRAIDTIGYRGMHSYEVAFDGWFVAAENLDRRRGRASGGASTTRWRGSRTAGCRPRPGPSASCRPPTRRPATTPPTGSCSASPIADYQLTQAKLGPHGGDHPGRPPVRLRRGPADGQGRGRARGVDGQGLRVQGGRVGHPRGACRSTAAWATPRSTR